MNHIYICSYYSEYCISVFLICYDRGGLCCEKGVIKNKIIEHIVEVTGKPFRFIEFDALVYCDDFEKLPTKGIASTLSSIKDDKILKELENLNWKNFKESI